MVWGALTLMVVGFVRGYAQARVWVLLLFQRAGSVLVVGFLRAIMCRSYMYQMLCASMFDCCCSRATELSLARSLRHPWDSLSRRMKRNIGQVNITL